MNICNSLISKDNIIDISQIEKGANTILVLSLEPQRQEQTWTLCLKQTLKVHGTMAQYFSEGKYNTQHKGAWKMCNVKDL